MARYEVPTAIEDGMILGRANLGVYRSNRNYFYGLADRWSCVPRGALNVYFTGTQKETIAWDGYHLLWSDAMNLHYDMSMAGDRSCRLKLTYNGTLIREIRGGDTVAGAQYDLSTLGLETPGLYRVQFTMTRTDGGTATNATIRAPYTTYTGTQKFTTPPVIHTGDTSNTRIFDVWRANDQYFNAITPPQPPFSSESAGWGSSGSKSATFWRGWARHLGPTRVYFWVSVTAQDSRNRADNGLRLYYGDTLITDNRYAEYDDVHATLQPISQQSEAWEGYFDVPQGIYAAGTWVPVSAQIYRGASSSTFTSDGLEDDPFTPWDESEFGDSAYDVGATSAVNYIYTAPPPGIPVGVLNTLTVNDYLTPTVPETMSDFDRYINGRLKRYDYAVRSKGVDDGSAAEGYRFKRRYDTLYYLGEGIEITWGTDQRQSLPDVSEGYGEFDLIQVDGLHYGTIYRVTGDLLFYAMEA